MRDEHPDVWLGRRLGKGPRAEEGEEAAANSRRRGWRVYLLVLLPVAVFLLWNSVNINGWNDLLYVGGFVVLSCGGGALVEYTRVSGHHRYAFTSVVVAYVGAVIAALCLAVTQPPQLPLVEVESERGAAHDCSEVSSDELYVLVHQSEDYWFVYNQEGLLALPNQQAEVVRFLECPGYLDRG